MSSSNQRPGPRADWKIPFIRIVAIGVFLGLVVTTETIRVTPQLATSPWFAFLFAGPVVAMCAFASVVLGVTIVMVVGLARRTGLEGGRFVSAPVLWTAALFALVWMACDEIAREIEFPSAWKWCLWLSLAAVTVAFLRTAWRRAASPTPFIVRIERLLVALLVPLSVALVLYFFRDSRIPGDSIAADFAPRFAPEPAGALEDADGARRSRVLFVGIDGASWDRIDRGVAEGRLPAFARLLARGRRAELQTLVPTRSPAIWTTMVTGVRPEAHGITDYHLLLLPRLGVGDLRVRRVFSPVRNAFVSLGELHRVLVTSSLRRRKAIWNLADEAGLRSVVLGLWATWPPEPLRNGLVASDHASHRYPGHVSTYPASLSERLDRFRRSPESITRAELAEFVPVDDVLWEEFQRTPVFVPGNRLSAFRATKLVDEFFASAARLLWHEEDPDLLIVYLRAVDEFSHFFYEMGVPEAEELGWSSEDVRRYANVVDRIYEWTDRRLSALVEAVDRDPSTLLVVVSDHGWRKQRSGHYEHRDGPPGILVLYGSGVCREACVPMPGASVYDVAPTILWRMRLPASEEMPGRVLEEAFVDAPPRVKVARFGDRLGAGAPVASTIDADAHEKMKALGYVQ